MSEGAENKVRAWWLRMRSSRWLGGLTPLERTAATLFGLGGVGVGGVGVFVSDNQAGTTTILIIGAGFLLMAVQGTRITKLGREAVELANLEAKAQDFTATAGDLLPAKPATDEAGKQQAAEDLRVAEKLTKAAESIFPEIAANESFQDVRNKMYEQQVFNALSEQLELVAGGPDAKYGITGTGLTYGGPGEASINLWLMRGNLRKEFRVVPRFLEKYQVPEEGWLDYLASLARHDNENVLVITNRFVGKSAVERVGKWVPLEKVQFARWAEPAHDEHLGSTLLSIADNSNGWTDVG